MYYVVFFFFFKQKTAYEMRISDWSSDVCSSDLPMTAEHEPLILDLVEWVARQPRSYAEVMEAWRTSCPRLPVWEDAVDRGLVERRADTLVSVTAAGVAYLRAHGRSEEHTSELQSLMRISYAVFCLKKKTNNKL